MKKWRDVLRENFTNWEVLADFLELDPTQRQRVTKKHIFSLNVPKRLVEKMQKNNLDDPLFKQFVPLTTSHFSPLESVDPVGDQLSCRSTKLLHKYQGRALLLATSACAMHCRYCFRQYYPYDTEKQGYEEELTLLHQDSSIKEIILSGGDPLSLSHKTLENLLRSLDAIPHLQRLRFHTRFPIGIPERIDEELLTLLSSLRLKVWVIIHCNHVVELDTDVIQALKKLQNLGIPVLNQSVLLKGVNDSADSLQALFEKMVDEGIVPYYLHQLDRVQGSAEFEVPVEKGHDLIQELLKRLPGYAVPRYVQEVAGVAHKTPLF